jgi:drug/metabolite transporter (DMT)-like permease
MPTITQPQPQTIATPQTNPRTAAIRARFKSTRLRAYATLALGVVCIGFSAIFTRWSGVPGPVSAFYRVLIATVALAIPYGVHLVRERRRGRLLGVESKRNKLTPALLGMTALAGLFFAGDLASWNTSLWFTSAANSTLLGNLSTLWVSLGALLIFHESLKRRFWVGMSIAVAGVIIVVGRDAVEQLQFSWGDLLAVGSSLFYASYILTTGRTRRQMGTLPFMWLNTAAATVILPMVVSGGAGPDLARARLALHQLFARPPARPPDRRHIVVAAGAHRAAGGAPAGRRSLCVPDSGWVDSTARHLYGQSPVTP